MSNDRDAVIAAALDQLRTAAAIDDWHTFDAIIKETQAMLAAQPSAEPVAYCRRDTVLNWKGNLMNVAMMFPSPVGLKDPIPLYAPPAPPRHRQEGK